MITRSTTTLAGRLSSCSGHCLDGTNWAWMARARQSTKYEYSGVFASALRDVFVNGEAL